MLVFHCASESIDCRRRQCRQHGCCLDDQQLRMDRDEQRLLGRRDVGGERQRKWNRGIQCCGELRWRSNGNDHHRWADLHGLAGCASITTAAPAFVLVHDRANESVRAGSGRRRNTGRCHHDCELCVVCHDSDSVDRHYSGRERHR